MRTYVRTYVVGHAQECHAECRYIYTIVVGHTGQGLTHSDTLNSDIDRGRRSLTMEVKVGDDVTTGPSRLGYYKHLTAYPTAKVTRATRLTCTRIYNARA